MADTKPDCARIPQIITEINNTSAQLVTLRKEMDDLGFGTAKTLRLVIKAQDFAKALGKLPPEVWQVLYDFVRCNDDGLATLTIEQLQLLVRALAAHALYQLETLPDKKELTPDQAALLKAFQAWWPELNAIITQFTLLGKDKLVALIKAAKQTIKKVAPKVLDVLVDVFGDQIKEAIISKAIDTVAGRKAIISAVAKQVVKAALGKAAASQVNPFVGVALTGWELIVELAGSSAATDIQTYVNALLLKLVLLMKDCGWKWPQNALTLPDGTEFRGFIVKGDKYLGASVVARAFVRCATIVKGQPQWSATPCPVNFESGATVSVKLTDDLRKDGRWAIPAVISMASVADAPCLKGAKYCYAYLQLSITLSDDTKTVLNIICGVQTFP